MEGITKNRRMTGGFCLSKKSNVVATRLGSPPQRVDGGERVPSGDNAEVVSDPQDINRNKDLARQCQRRRLRLRTLSPKVTEGQTLTP